MLKTYVKANRGWWLKITKEDLADNQQQWNAEIGDGYYKDLVLEKISEDGVIYINRVGVFNSFIGDDATEEIQAEDFPENDRPQKKTN